VTVGVRAIVRAAVVGSAAIAATIGQAISHSRSPICHVGVGLILTDRDRYRQQSRRGSDARRKRQQRQLAQQREPTSQDFASSLNQQRAVSG
jgi:hypothetical protein